MASGSVNQSLFGKQRTSYKLKVVLSSVSTEIHPHVSQMCTTMFMTVLFIVQKHKLGTLLVSIGE